MSRWSVLLGATAAIAFASISTTGCKNGGGADNLGFFIPPQNLASISSVIPSSGSILGSNSITIIGSNFAPGATATVGGTTLLNIAVPNTFTLTGIIPAGNYAPGAVDVAVVTSSQSAILTKGYTFEDMTFTSITPNNGPITGNIPVVIRGTNFKDILLNGVTLSSTTNANIFVQLQNVVVNATFDTINAIVPPGLPLGPYALTINSASHGIKNFGAVYTVGTGQSTTMLITDIRSQPGNVSPAHGPLAGGTVVTLTADLSAPAPAGFVGGLNVTIIFPDGTVLNGSAISVSANFGQLTFTTPAGPANFFGGPVTIRVDSATQGFATAANGFSYDPTGSAPALNTISPALGPQGGGTLVTAVGVNFKAGAVSNVRRVTVGGVPATGLAVQSTNQIQFTTPPGNIGLQPVIVESTTGAPSNSVNFQYQQAIVLNRINPDNGPSAGGNSVTVSGQNFTTATILSGSITIGGNPVANITVVNSTTVTGIVPKGTIGPVDVTVLANGGLPGMTLRLAYTYGPSFDPPFNGGGPDATVLFDTTIPQPPVANDIAQAMATTTALNAFVVNGTDNSMSLVPFVASLSSATVATRIPNGDVRFVGGVGNAPFANPIDVKIGNMTGPGSQDIVVLNNEAGGAGQQSISVIRNNNNGSFTVIVSRAVASAAVAGLLTLNAVSIDVADVNADGHPDVAVLGASGTIQNGVGILFGQAGGTLAAAGTFTLLGATELGGAQVRIVGPTSPSFQANPFTGSLAVDMNSDGIPDIVTVCKTSATVSVFAGKGDGTFTLLTTTSVGATNPVAFDVADMDASGTLDIITANNGNGTNGTVSVLLGNGAGALALQGPFGVVGFPAANFKSVIVGDVNFDCRPDVVVANSNGWNLAVFLGNGDGTLSAPVQYVSQTASLVSTANIAQILPLQQSNGLAGVICLDRQSNGGNLSYMTLVPRHILDAYFGDYQPSPPNPLFRSVTQGLQPQSVTFGDLNGDGRQDMVVVNRASNNLQVFIGDGFGNFLQPFAPIPFNPGAQPESVLIARVDNTSGFPSVLVACNGLNAVALLRNFGGGSLGNPTYIPVDGTGPHQVLVQDMNGDGKADIITVNQFSNNITILIGDGTGGFARAVHSPYPVGNGPLAAAVADMNGDGVPDIAVCNFASSDVTLLLANPLSLSATDVQFNFSTVQLGGSIATDPLIATTTGPVAVTRGAVEPRSIAIGDLNGDGAPDIVTADSLTGTVTILYGKCQALLRLNGANLAGVVPGDTLTGPQIGVAPGNSVDPAAPFYRMKVVSVVSANQVLVTDITGGGRPLAGDPQFDPSNPFLTGLSPRLPAVFFGPNAVTGYAGDPIKKGAGTVGTVGAVSQVVATGHFFAPSDYLSDGTTTNVGSPSVIIKVGANPSVVKLFDMNSDGFLDIVVGLEDGSQIVNLINQAEADFESFRTIGLLQTAFNTPSFGTRQLDTGGVLVGLPKSTVSPAGEFTFKAADKLVYGLPDFPSVPHNGYPIFVVTPPLVAATSDVAFKQSTTGHVLGMDIAHITLDCPPSVAVVTDDNFVTVYKAK